MRDASSYGFGTRCIHAGQAPDPATGAIMTPIFQTSTYVQEGPNVNKGFDYSRVNNPTRVALEGNLASLEGALYGMAFSSGVGAMDAILKKLNPGDHVVTTNDLYGGSYRLFTKTFARFGLSFSFVDMTDLDAVEAAMTPQTKLVWVETPTNPLMRVIDIARVSEIAHARGADVAVDNTFATPYLQQPLALGADLVMHSATKYLGGHSDVILGAVMTSRDDWHEALRFNIKTTGAVPGPMDCFLVLRGTKTLHLRMERHCANGRAVARFLAGHPKVARVFWPGQEDSPGHALAREQMRDFGGMMSFTLKEDSVEAATRVLTGTKVFQLAESLGGVESLIEHPASMTHGSIPPEERRRAGFFDSLIRLSVGVEDEADLLADLERALG